MYHWQGVARFSDSHCDLSDSGLGAADASLLADAWKQSDQQDFGKDVQEFSLGSVAECVCDAMAATFPMTMATWGVICQERIDCLTAMMIFMIFGIGVDFLILETDDVLVLADAWQQSGQQGSESDFQEPFFWDYH